MEKENSRAAARKFSRASPTRRPRTPKPARTSCIAISAGWRWSWTGFKKKAGEPSVAEHRRMIEPEHPSLSVTRQCDLLGAGAGELLSCPRAGGGGEPALDAGDRRDVFGLSVFWFPAAGALATAPRPRRESQTRAAADAADGLGGDLPEAEPVARPDRSAGLSESVAPSGGDAIEPGLGDGHHQCAGAGRLRVSLRGPRLAQPLRARVGTVQHARRELLRARRPAGHRTARPAENLQPRPGGASSLRRNLPPRCWLWA